MTKKLISIGECMVEMSVQPDGHYAIGFAGDTFNTAWYCRHLAGPELDVSYVSAIGDDELSARMRTFIEDAGITTHLPVRKNRTVGLYLISLKNGERTFSYWRDTSAAKTMVDDLDALPGSTPGDIAYFSGITLAILNPTQRRKLLGILAGERGKGVQIAFDPNLRPALWPDNNEMCQWITKAATIADIVLPSFEDESRYFNDKNTADTAQRYLEAGVSTVIVKDGKNPVFAVHEKQYHHIQTSETEVIDSTAAGDSFNAAFLVGMESGEEIESAVKKACEVAAKVVAHRGALVDVQGHSAG